MSPWSDEPPRRRRCPGCFYPYIDVAIIVVVITLILLIGWWVVTHPDDVMPTETQTQT